jgi:hypothetical protein
VTPDTQFPSITFPATFDGAGAIGADFSTTLKFKPDDGLKVLQDLKLLPRGKYDITVVARQAVLEGDSVDREWSSMQLQEDMQDADELDYEQHCLGGRCPHFAVATEGELEGAYVCQLDPEAPVKIVHGETECPLGVPEGEEDPAEDDAGEPETVDGEAEEDESDDDPEDDD